MLIKFPALKGQNNEVVDMRAISAVKAKKMLSPLGLSIGDWNEVVDIRYSSENLMCQPPRLATEIYIFCRLLVQWLSCERWVIVQVDNSTSPLEDEVEVMKDVFAMEISNQLNSNASFIMDGDGLRSRVAMFIFFVIIFEWHVYLVSANSENGKRLGLQDGVAYFFGSKSQLEDASSAVEKFKSSPLTMIESESKESD